MVRENVDEYLQGRENSLKIMKDTELLELNLNHGQFENSETSKISEISEVFFRDF